MPWTGSYGFPFNHASILANAPTSSGVFALFTPKVWVYIGESDDVRRALLELESLFEHVTTRPESWLWKYPTLAFGFLGAPAPERAARLKTLVEELKPECNAAV